MRIYNQIRWRGKGNKIWSGRKTKPRFIKCISCGVVYRFFFCFFFVQNLPIKYHASIIADKIYEAMSRNEAKIGRRNIFVYFLVTSAKVSLGNCWGNSYTMSPVLNTITILLAANSSVTTICELSDMHDQSSISSKCSLKKRLLLSHVSLNILLWIPFISF